MAVYTPLRIRAEDSEDLQLMAACLQDALIPVSGIEFNADAHQFHLVANRFCWECEDTDHTHNRVVAGLAFHNVHHVVHQGLESRNDNELLNLLTLTLGDDGAVHLVFSGGVAIKLQTVDALVCHLTDMEEPYPTSHKPVHE